MIILNTYHQSSSSSYTQLHHQGYIRFMDLFDPYWHRVPVSKKSWDSRLHLLIQLSKE